jgi:hypothetical protein
MIRGRTALQNQIRGFEGSYSGTGFLHGPHSHNARSYDPLLTLRFMLVYRKQQNGRADRFHVFKYVSDNGTFKRELRPWTA